MYLVNWLLKQYILLFGSLIQPALCNRTSITNTNCCKSVVLNLLFLTIATRIAIGVLFEHKLLFIVVSILITNPIA